MATLAAAGDEGSRALASCLASVVDDVLGLPRAAMAAKVSELKTQLPAVDWAVVFGGTTAPVKEEMVVSPRAAIKL